MGTNASNKRKVASKVLAILLATLMLLAAMPMTAFAASPLDAQIVVEGLTLLKAPQTMYVEGGKFTFAGMKLEVTIRSIEAVNADEYKANRVAYVIDGDYEAEFTKYGIDCNYEEGQKMTLADNLVPLTFTFGPGSSLSLETRCFPAVYPDSWDFGEQILGFYVGEGSDSRGFDKGDGEYLIVANDDTLVSTLPADKDVIGTLLSQYSLATYGDIEVEAKSVINLSAQIEALDEELTVDNFTWEINGVDSDDDNNYIVSFSDLEGFGISDAHLNDLTRENEWPIVMKEGESVDWTLTSAEDGEMYIAVSYTDVIKEVELSGTDVVVVEKEVEKTVNVYFAVNDKGFAYLTTDETKAASISIYRIVEALVNDIEIVDVPDKMEYIEGEGFEGAGMTVNLLCNDTVVLTVPYELFDVFGIECSYEDGDTLTVKADNGKSLWVEYEGTSIDSEIDCWDDSVEKIVVKAAPDATYTLVEKGSFIADGNYVIAYIDGTDGIDGQRATAAATAFDGKLEKNVLYNGIALDADAVEAARGFMAEPITDSNYNISTLSGSMIEVFNGKVGRYNDYFVNTSGVDDSMVWTIKFDAAQRAYTIQQASTGLYLNRSAISYKDAWVFGVNYSESTDAILGTVKTISLGDLCADSYWVIDGTYDAAIQSPASIETENNFYLLLEEIAVAVEPSTIGKMPEDIVDNFYFFKSDALTVSSIEVKAGTTAYNSGDKLDLDAYVVVITYANGKVVEVPFEDFEGTTSIADGTVLSASNKEVVFSFEGKTAKVALTVADSAADVTTVRLGGADRYETATIIATSYVAALGDNYKGIAVLANGVQFPDALAGSTLAAALNAPIVLTKADSLNKYTKDFFTKNEVKTVYILGGESAVSADVEAALKDMGITVNRIKGADRVETSLAIATELAKVKTSDTIIFTNGANFADALSVSSAAAKLGAPVLYVNGSVSENVKTFVKASGATKAIILGGTAAVSEASADQIADLGLTVTRIGGIDRFETSVNIAKHFADCFTGTAVTLATGKDFPDALAGGVCAAIVGAPVVLVDNGYANTNAASYIAGIEGLTHVYVFGGTAAVSNATVDALLLK